MAAHQKSDRRRVYLCAGGLRKYVEDLSVTSVSKKNAAGWFIKLSAVIGKGLRHGGLIGQDRSSLPP
jgi:hypothetical protein